MKSCGCKSYPDLETGAALRKWTFDSKTVLRRLMLLATHAGGEYQLLHCLECGQLWQRSLNWMQGNRAYAFKVPQIGIDDWEKKPYVSPDELFSRFWHLNEYLKSASFEEQERLCKLPECTEHATKFSVFCAFHHIQNLNFKTEVPDDYRWFAPYVRTDFDLSIDDVKALPNYKAIS